MNQHFYKDLVLFIISILVISCAKGESTKQTIDEQIAPNGTTIRKDALYYWDQTGLNYAFFKEHISTDTCYQSPEIFIGCMEAVNSILKFYKTPEALDLIFVPKTYLFTIKGYNIEPVENLGFFRDIKLIKSITPKKEFKMHYLRHGENFIVILTMKLILNIFFLGLKKR